MIEEWFVRGDEEGKIEERREERGRGDESGKGRVVTFLATSSTSFTPGMQATQDVND